MRYVLSLILAIFVMCEAKAQNIRAMSDAEQLGMTAGLAMACGADKKLEDFDLISARILANQSPTDEAERREAKVYAQAKWDAMMRQKKGKQSDCKEIIEHFNKLPLFNSIVYSDGSVKLPDGTWSRPLRPIQKR